VLSQVPRLLGTLLLLRKVCFNQKLREHTSGVHHYACMPNLRLDNVQALTVSITDLIPKCRETINHAETTTK
jgi:hypothetical protein